MACPCPLCRQGQACPFTFDELVLEVVGPHRSFPIVTDFDCGHTHPTITIAEVTRVTLVAGRDFDSRIVSEEPMVMSR